MKASDWPTRLRASAGTLHAGSESDVALRCAADEIERLTQALALALDAHRQPWVYGMDVRITDPAAYSDLRERLEPERTVTVPGRDYRGPATLCGTCRAPRPCGCGRGEA